MGVAFVLRAVGLYFDGALYVQFVCVAVSVRII